MDDDFNLDADGADLCIHCLKPIGQHACFCIHCRAPLSFLAGTVSYYSVLAEGFIYRTAVQQPKRLFVVIGVWAVFGSMAISGGMLVWLYHTLGDYMAAWVIMFYQLLHGLYTLIGISGVYQSTMNFLEYRNSRKAVPPRIDEP